MNATKRSAVTGTLAELLAHVEQMKAAEAHSEPGSIGGETEHPIKKVDDNSEDAQEGSRSSENTSDVKEDQGPMGVESAPKSAAGSQEDEAEKIGPMEPKSTGKDPSVETGGVKGDKEDGSIGGDTSHPATTEDGEKYGSVIEQLEAYCKQADALGRSILTRILKEAEEAPPAAAAGAKPAGEKAAEGKAAKEAATSSKEEEEAVKAAQAGYDLAGVFANIDVPVQDKRACDQLVVARIKQAADHGLAMAEAARQYYQGFFAQKQADEEGEPPAEEGQEESSEDDEAGSGGTPPGTDDQAMPSEEELLAMLGGAGDMGGGMGGGGGMPPAAGGGGMPPAAGGGGDLAALLGGGGGAEAGGMPPDAMGGGMPGAGGMGGGMPGEAGAGAPQGDEALLMQLIQELGIDPTMLEQKAAQALAAKRQKQSAKTAGTDKQSEQRKSAMKKMLLDLIRN